MERKMLGLQGVSSVDKVDEERSGAEGRSQATPFEAPLSKNPTRLSSKMYRSPWLVGRGSSAATDI